MATIKEKLQLTLNSKCAIKKLLKDKYVYDSDKDEDISLDDNTEFKDYASYLGKLIPNNINEVCTGIHYISDTNGQITNYGKFNYDDWYDINDKSYGVFDYMSYINTYIGNYVPSTENPTWSEVFNEINYYIPIIYPYAIDDTDYGFTDDGIGINSNIILVFTPFDGIIEIPTDGSKCITFVDDMTADENGLVVIDTPTAEAAEEIPGVKVITIDKIKDNDEAARYSDIIDFGECECYSDYNNKFIITRVGVKYSVNDTSWNYNNMDYFNAKSTPEIKFSASSSANIDYDSTTHKNMNSFTHDDTSQLNYFSEYKGRFAMFSVGTGAAYQITVARV